MPGRLHFPRHSFTIKRKMQFFGASLGRLKAISQTLDGVEIRLAGRGQLASAAVCQRPDIAKPFTITGTVGNNALVALEEADAVVDERVDLV